MLTGSETQNHGIEDNDTARLLEPVGNIDSLEQNSTRDAQVTSQIPQHSIFGDYFTKPLSSIWDTFTFRAYRTRDTENSTGSNNSNNPMNDLSLRVVNSQVVTLNPCTQQSFEYNNEETKKITDAVKEALGFFGKIFGNVPRPLQSIILAIAPIAPLAWKVATATGSGPVWAIILTQENAPLLVATAVALINAFGADGNAKLSREAKQTEREPQSSVSKLAVKASNSPELLAQLGATKTENLILLGQNTENKRELEKLELCFKHSQQEVAKLQQQLHMVTTLSQCVVSDITASPSCSRSPVIHSRVMTVSHHSNASSKTPETADRAKSEEDKIKQSDRAACK